MFVSPPPAPQLDTYLAGSAFDRNFLISPFQSSCASMWNWHGNLLQFSSLTLLPAMLMYCERIDQFGVPSAANKILPLRWKTNSQLPRLTWTWTQPLSGRSRQGSKLFIFLSPVATPGCYHKVQKGLPHSSSFFPLLGSLITDESVFDQSGTPIHTPDSLLTCGNRWFKKCVIFIHPSIHPFSLITSLSLAWIWRNSSSINHTDYIDI